MNIQDPLWSGAPRTDDMKTADELEREGMALYQRGLKLMEMGRNKRMGSGNAYQWYSGSLSQYGKSFQDQVADQLRNACKEV